MAKNFKVSLTIEAFTKGIDQILEDLDNVNKKAEKVGKQLEGFGKSLTKNVTLPIAAFAAISIKAFRDQERNIAKFTDSFEKQGARIGFSLNELKKQAEDFGSDTLFQDDDILGNVTSQLLNFSIETKKIFSDAQRVILDFSAKTGTDLGAATEAIGKALQNPTEGLNLLRRAGLAVTDQQILLISNLDKTGRAAEAQAAVIQLLQNQYGGFAQKLAQTDTGALDALIKKFNELREDFGQAFIQVLRPLIDALAGIIDALRSLEPETKVLIAGFASIIAAAGPLIFIIGNLILALRTLGITLGSLAGAAGVIGLVVVALIAASEAFDGLKNAALSFALQINKYFKAFLDLIQAIPDAFNLIIPGLNILKIAAKSVGDIIQGNIDSLNSALDESIALQQSANDKIFTQEEIAADKLKRLREKQAAENLALAQKNEEARLKILSAAEDDLQREREARAKDLPKQLEGSFNIPADAAQNAQELNGILTQTPGKLDDINKKLVELNDVGRIFANSFTTAFTNIISGAESVGQSFANLGRNIINGIASAAIQSAFNSLFRNLGTVFAGSDLFPTGAAPIAGNAEGGLITGPGTGTSDSILSRLSNGEFVMKADAVKKWGVGFMHALNRGFMPAFASGGMLDNYGNYLNSIPRYAEGGIVNARQSSVNVNVINNSSQPVSAKSSQTVDVRGTVVNIILEDLKTNGPISQGNQQAFGLKR